MNENARWMPLFPGYRVGEIGEGADRTLYFHFCGNLVRISFIPDAVPFNKWPMSGFIRREELKRCLTARPVTMLDGGILGHGITFVHVLGAYGRGTYTSEAKLYIPETLAKTATDIITRYEAGERLVYRGPFGATVGIDRYGDRRESYPNHPLNLPGWNECGEEARYGELFIQRSEYPGWQVRAKITATSRVQGEQQTTRRSTDEVISLDEEAFYLHAPNDTAKRDDSRGLSHPSYAQFIAKISGAFVGDIVDIFQEFAGQEAAIIFPIEQRVLRLAGQRMRFAHPDVNDEQMRVEFPRHQGRAIEAVPLLPLLESLTRIIASFSPQDSVAGIGIMSRDDAKALQTLFWGNE